VLPATLLVLVFLTANMGVMVIGVAPIKAVAGTVDTAFFPRVLRSITLLVISLPRAAGAIVGMVGESWGRVIASTSVFLPNVLNSMTSAALAAAIMPNRKALAAKIVRIDFIYESTFRQGVYPMISRRWAFTIYSFCLFNKRLGFKNLIYQSKTRVMIRK